MNAAEKIRAARQRLSSAQLITFMGRVESLGNSGIVAELPNVRIGEVCKLVDPGSAQVQYAKVIAFEQDKAVLLPLDEVGNLSSATEVIPLGKKFTFTCSNAMLGHVLNGLGQSMEGHDFSSEPDSYERSVDAEMINPLNRPPIDQIFHTGIRSIDGLLTLGEGQRIGMFGEPGSGKSSLLGSLARNGGFDVCVLALIGERGREVREFLDRQLPPEFRARCVTVVSTSDTPAMQRLIGGKTAISIAEHFRDQGKKVLLLFDSITRYARALREVGLSAGEVAVRNGYPPSVYTELPKIIERCGRTEGGVITALFSVLTENAGKNDPIAEEVQSLTDGHILLSSELGNQGHYPAIDVLKSKSRLMQELVDVPHSQNATKLRSLMAKYNEVEILIQVGEYREGGDKLADEAVRKREMISGFLKQSSDHNIGWEELTQNLDQICGG